MSNDHVSTIAGGAAGVLLLQTVRWELIPAGEAVKVGVAVVLALVGYLMYRNPPEMK